jgi:hypothetical protein
MRLLQFRFSTQRAMTRRRAFCTSSNTVPPHLGKMPRGRVHVSQPAIGWSRVMRNLIGPHIPARPAPHDLDRLA